MGDVEDQSKSNHDVTIPTSPSMPPLNKDETSHEMTTPPVQHDTILSGVCRFYNQNSFLILVVIAILLAFAYPPLGAIYMYPQITATWIAVIFIFVMAGLSLQTQELANAFKRIPFNLFVQIFNFLIVSVIVYGVSRLLVSLNAISLTLADGMTISACLPVAINMCMVLTKSAGGDDAAAVFNSAFGNMVGVFLTPLLILMYLGVQGDMDLEDVFFKLSLRVLVPIVAGQLLQKCSTWAVGFVKNYKKYFKMWQEWCLVFIVYTVFCKTFGYGPKVDPTSIFLMISLQFILLVFVMLLSWSLLRLFFPHEPKLVVMGLFGCTQKTVAMGVPLINTMYAHDINVGLYTLPILVWHPMQLLIGTVLAPRLARFVEREEERIATGTEPAEVQLVEDWLIEEDGGDKVNKEEVNGEMMR